MSRWKDIRGEKRGRLVVIKYDDPGRWLCRCACGEMITVQTSNLNNGHTRSCGCLNRETRATVHRTHGLSRTSEYRIWRGVRDRCFNPRNHAFADYGGRGITVCARWNSFAHFLADVGPRPTPHHSLDRKDNGKGYSKKNCRWATKIQQANNSRSNLRLELHGRIMTQAEWARELGIKTATICCRLRYYGWSVERALTTRPGKGRCPATS